MVLVRRHCLLLVLFVPRDMSTIAVAPARPRVVARAPSRRAHLRVARAVSTVPRASSSSSSGADADSASPPTVGFVGAGAMAEALARGFVAGGVASFDAISCSNGGDAERLERWRSLGASPRASNADVLASSDVVFLAVKPHVLPGVLAEIAPHVHPARHLLVSVAAGVSADFIESELADARARLGAESDANPAPIRVVRVMPNTPCLVGAAASAASVGSASTPADLDLVLRLMRGAGTCDVVEERLMDAVVGVSGSGPAYAFQFIEAMADGGVAAGLPRATAQALAAQTVMGAAKMVLETGEHPGALKDKVCSPGGTTIRAVHALERGGLRAAVIDAVLASAARSAELGQKR